MRLIVAAAVTPEDVKRYFTGHWRTSVRKGGLIVAESKNYLVELHPKSAVFAVRIEAHDDPSDSDEGVTDDPAKFITDFLKTGTAGDEVFGKMAGLIRRSAGLGPRELAGVLRFLADEAESGRLGRRAAAMAVRRAAALAGAPAPRTASDQGPAELKEMAGLQAKMKEKGWRSKVGQDDRDLPEMTVDVAGVYEAKVSVHGLMWGHFFQVQGRDDVVDEGVTDDPIEAFRAWRKSKKVQEVRAEQESKAGGHPRPEDKGTEPAPEPEGSEERTEPAPEEAKAEPEEKTVPPPKKKKPAEAAE